MRDPVNAEFLEVYGSAVCWDVDSSGRTLWQLALRRPSAGRRLRVIDHSQEYRLTSLVANDDLASR